MNIEQTRQLGIEFERRVQTMIPQKEISEKLDTETIYSYLNQYQDEYINTIYTTKDRIPSDTSQIAHFELILLPLFSKQTIEKLPDGNWVFGDNLPITFYENNCYVTFVMPSDFCMYVSSTSVANGQYRFRHSDKAQTTVSNVLVSTKEFYSLVESYNNRLRILRHPIVSLNKTYDGVSALSVLYDNYTNIQEIQVCYYRSPKHFSILTGVPCELPFSAFDDIVNGAVDLYVQYVAGAEARRRQQIEDARKQAEANLRNNRESNTNEDEQ